MSRRNQELLFLLLAGAVSTMAYVSVYASRFREIDTVAVVPGVSADIFKEKVDFSKKNCPISKALAAVEITLSASLA